MRLRDVDAPDGCWLVLFRLEPRDEFLDVVYAETIQRLTIDPRGHVARLALEPFIGQEVQRRVVQQPIEIAIDPVWVATILAL